MTKILATCVSCSEDVDLVPAQVVARTCADNGHSSYAFRCPRCRTAVSLDATAHVIERLVQVGVRSEVWNLPAELTEYRETAPLTEDDLVAFRMFLNGRSDPAERFGAEAIPQDSLAVFMASAVDEGRSVGPDDVADHFKVTTDTARRALRLLLGAAGAGTDLTGESANTTHPSRHESNRLR